MKECRFGKVSLIKCLNTVMYAEFLCLFALLLVFCVPAFCQQLIEAQRSKFNGVWVYNLKDNKEEKSPLEGRKLTITYTEPKFQIEETWTTPKGTTQSQIRIFLTDGSEEKNPERALEPATEIEPKTRWDQAVLFHQYKMIFNQVDPPNAKNILQMDSAEEYRVSDDGSLLYVTNEGTITYQGKGKKSRKVNIYRRKT